MFNFQTSRGSATQNLDVPEFVSYLNPNLDDEFIKMCSDVLMFYYVVFLTIGTWICPKIRTPPKKKPFT